MSNSRIKCRSNLFPRTNQSLYNYMYFLMQFKVEQCRRKMDKGKCVNKNDRVYNMSLCMKDGSCDTKGRKKRLKKKINSDFKLIVIKHKRNARGYVQKLSETVVEAQVVKDINQVCSIFKGNLIVVNKWTVLVLGTVSDSLTLLQEDANCFKKIVQKNDIFDLCLSKEAFVICTEYTSENYLIRKSIETQSFFSTLEEHVKEIFKCESYIRIYSEDLNYSHKQENKHLPDGNKNGSYLSDNFEQLELTEAVQITDNTTVYRNNNNKVIPPRKIKSNLKVLAAVPQRTFVCYPLTGTFHLNPAMPSEEPSFPTQASEQSEQGTDEVVFSNGRSIQVDHMTRRLSSRQPQASSNPGHFARNLDDRYTNQTPHSRLDLHGVNKRPPKPPRYPNYVDYHQRLKSYARWVKRHPDPTTLCTAGFFFTNEADLVRCYQCGIGLKDFSYGDDPLKEHVRHSRECPFLQECIEPDRLAVIKTEVLPAEHTNTSAAPRQGPDNGYRHQAYTSYNARLSSFSKWPPRLMQTPHQLAEAGLFYTGFEDNVRCFACDGGLRKWDPEDDPWTEHCRWFPDCPYVREQKGEEYVRLVQATVANEDQNKTTEGQAAPNDKNGADITSELERLTLKDPELNAGIAEHRDTCLEMGYAEKDFEKAAYRLAQGGTVRPTIEDILDAMNADQEAERAATRQNKVAETPVEENMRLKSMIICMSCGVNSVNALFLPCTHHRMCMECAQLIGLCPVCDRVIRQKIRTYMA